MGAAQINVTHGDDFIQPFTVTLDQSRTLDGTETWRSTVRKTKTGSILASFSSGEGTIAIDGITFQPSIVFSPARFTSIPIPDDDYLYDLEMQKGGKRETVAIDTLAVTGDLTR